ncbi:hypothetical protein FMEXI_6362 [Fusarium mexicanum]|uniref:Uncharacterized protein n=1 Tax=Fusarium mexicanum TaxID=751941 RepID=A0A8H5MY11_9HYPO|nr:hypothetical protein FMEXI_6362 [Fusarium mexicanum]
MFLLPMLLTFPFFTAAHEGGFQREAVDFTIEAGTLVGTGLIEFASDGSSQTTQNTEALVTETLKYGKGLCGPTTTCEASTAAVFLTKEISLLPAPTLPSRILSVNHTRALLPSNISLEGTPISSPTSPMISEATSSRHMACIWLLGSMAVGSFVFVI